MLTEWVESVPCGVTFPNGFRAAGVRCGLKAAGPDLALIAADADCTCAGVFTLNEFAAASVLRSRDVAMRGTARAVIVNAGNANACTGSGGIEANDRMADAAAGRLGCPRDSVLTASTGVIGQPMDVGKVEAGALAATKALSRGQAADESAAMAIMTTDLVMKIRAVEVQSSSWDRPVRFGAMCKGSGMIAPNMATMLAFVTCDASVTAGTLHGALVAATNRSFNCVTVDGDTSTNDLAIVLASGCGGAEIPASGAAADDFALALERVCTALARDIARDGEGARCLIEVSVVNAATVADARKIARTIAESPLVKTAIFGRDPNWGRILAAAGRAGVRIDPRTVTVSLGPHCVFRTGAATAADRDTVSSYLDGDTIHIEMDLGAGRHGAELWTCDLGYDYVRINAEYHT